MKRVVFDIETVGADFESLDPHWQEYLLRYAEDEAEKASIKESLGLFPVTAEIVTIAMYNPDTAKGAVAFQSPGPTVPEPFEEEGVQYHCGDERALLDWFWQSVAHYDQIITFNGRAFDAPFILVRTARHRLTPSKELMPNRYGQAHIDLMDQLTFFGASRRRFSLDIWCRFFDIQSPKEEGMSGKDVGRAFRQGQYQDIARYCMRDVKATAELFAIVEKHMRPNPKERG